MADQPTTASGLEVVTLEVHSKKRHSKNLEFGRPGAIFLTRQHPSANDMPAAKRLDEYALNYGCICHGYLLTNH